MLGFFALVVAFAVVMLGLSPVIVAVGKLALVFFLLFILLVLAVLVIRFNHNRSAGFGHYPFFFKVNGSVRFYRCSGSGLRGHGLVFSPDDLFLVEINRCLWLGSSGGRGGCLWRHLELRL